MKNRHIMAIVFCFCAFHLSAQFTDNMDYQTGDPLGEWWLCPGGGSNCIIVGGGVGYLPADGTSDVVLDLGSKATGVWTLEFEIYVPSGKEAYMNLQGEIPVTSGEWIVGNIFFNQDLANPGVGLIDDTALGEVTFDFPHDEWFPISLTVDMTNGMSTATWEFVVSNNIVVPAGTAFTNEAGNIPTSLGGVNFFSISSNNELYIDTFSYYGNGTSISQYEDDMESYIEGEPILNDWWGSWSSGSQSALTASSDQSRSGDLSGYIPGDGFTDPELNMGNKTDGKWALEFHMYIPPSREGYWNLQGQVPIGAGEWIVGNIFFNQDLASPGIGLIDDSALGNVNFNFPHGEWFRVVINVDLTNGMSNGTWELRIAGEEVIPAGTAFTDESGNVPTSLGGINFFSISADHELYVDDFRYMEGEFLGLNTSEQVNFSLYPNPSKAIVTINAQDEILTTRLYNIQGMLVKEFDSSIQLDISGMASGIYLIEVQTEKGKSTKKLIKE